MELALRSHLLAHLQGDDWLSAHLNAIVEEAPSRTSLPWLAIAASGALDWSCKTAPGREIRLALELHSRADESAEMGQIMAAIEDRIASLPRSFAGLHIASQTFLRSRVEQRAEARRSALIEYRFRLMSTNPEPTENQP